MGETDSYTGNVWIACAIEDVADFGTVGDSPRDECALIIGGV